MRCRPSPPRGLSGSGQSKRNELPQSFAGRRFQNGVNQTGCGCPLGLLIMRVSSIIHGCGSSPGIARSCDHTAGESVLAANLHLRRPRPKLDRLDPADRRSPQNQLRIRLTNR
jgi:hypothetical protein